MLTLQPQLPVIRLWPASWNPFESRLLSCLRATRESWRTERDMRAIERALDRLSERQLNMIGMSRNSLTSDVFSLIERAEAGRRFADEVIGIVDDRPHRAALPLPAR